jgi:hypothetical protein
VHAAGGQAPEDAVQVTGPILAQGAGGMVIEVRDNSHQSRGPGDHSQQQ